MTRIDILFRKTAKIIQKDKKNKTTSIMRNHWIIILLTIMIPLVSWGKLNNPPALTAEASSAYAGETAALTVNLNNGDIVCNGYQFRLVLPEGVSLVYDEDEEDYVYELASRYTKKSKMNVEINECEDGSYQLTCFSSNHTLTGREGPVISIGIQTDPSITPGNYQGEITDVIIYNYETGVSRKLENAYFNVTVTGGASSNATITVQTTEASPGGKSIITVCLNNGDIVCNGYQFMLVLPEGVTLAYDEEEEDYVYELANRYSKKNKMEVEIEYYQNGTYQLMCFSYSDQTLTGSEGAVISMDLQIEPSVLPGNHEGRITDAVLSNNETGMSEQMEDTHFTITVNGFSKIPGDVDGDNEVNITDVLIIVDYILGRPTKKFLFANADMDKSGTVNLTDALKIVDIILGRP